jgi:hypothetical protein
LQQLYIVKSREPIGFDIDDVTLFAKSSGYVLPKCLIVLNQQYSHVDLQPYTPVDVSALSTTPGRVSFGLKPIFILGV